MGKTKCGVYYDLRESEFHYVEFGITFYFSSRSHLQKFISRLSGAIDEYNEHIYKRYGIYPYANIPPAISLYLKIETRGFYVSTPFNDYDNIKDFEKDTFTKAFINDVFKKLVGD